ncbi:MAG: hypothetical protein Hyperionvirus9_61 [Hyperionvirus sp.]|uniref:Uncharacterized protein n=1 Tax=Hyperionvirus sp. TaxID=2487770 RepID=A0A3G5AAP7_9VIRU|nr:MAG: hypothetical protein Hyperionvirus9_61 [Hyperionvirus sp.]
MGAVDVSASYVIIFHDDRTFGGVGVLEIGEIFEKGIDVSEGFDFDESGE